ncbi:cytoskeleton-associated protein 4 [Gastrophryne carolinensis]
MTSARHRNKGGSPDTQPPASASDVPKKSHKGGKAPAAASSCSSSGMVCKAFSALFYALLIAAAAGTGWCVLSLREEMGHIRDKLQHLSEQKGEIALTVNSLHQQVDILEKTAGRVEFISKDIQEKQQRHDLSIKNSEKELDVVGVILKKLQKDLSNVIQDVKDQGDRDLVLFDKTMREKFTELNNSINEEIAELSEVQKSSQEEINNVKSTLASLGEVNSVTEELQKLKELFSELQASFKSKEETIDWLMNNAINGDAVTANGNGIAELKSQQESLKSDVEAHMAGIVALKEKLLSDDGGNVKAEFDRVLKDFEQLSSSVSEIENNYVSSNNDLLKEIETTKAGVEQKLTALESAFKALNSEKSSLVESFTSTFEEYSRRLNKFEESVAGVKHAQSKGAQEALSKQVEELRSAIAGLPNAASDLEKLQVEVTSALEGHQQQIEDLKSNYDQWKNNLANAGSSDQVLNDDVKASVAKLESDLLRLREAVDSLVAYSVKIETHDKDLESVKESIEDLKESTDKLLVKIEHIQESV